MWRQVQTNPHPQKHATEKTRLNCANFFVYVGLLIQQYVRIYYIVLWLSASRDPAPQEVP